VLVVGCSHPGIETIVRHPVRGAITVHAIFGGLHLVTTPDSAITRCDGAPRQVAIDQIAPGHCTGEPALRALKRLFGPRYLCRAGDGDRMP